MEMRKAVMEDVVQMSKMLEVFTTPNFDYSKVERISKYVQSGDYYVAAESDSIVGCMSLIENKGSMYIDSIVSIKKGAGKLMINFAVDRCKTENFLKLWCWSLARYDAVGFYRKMGFEEIFLLKNQWFGEDCYIIGKVIK